MSLKVTDVLNRFNGDGDVSVWLKQAHLAKSLLKLKNLAVVIPLFLNSPAFAVYDQLKEEEKRDADKIELTLRTAFACDKFLAYDEFRNRQWKNGESVDVYLADLKRLAYLANIDGKNEEIIKLSLVMRLSNKVSDQLRATPKIDTLDFSISISIFYFCSATTKTERNKQTYRTIAEEEKVRSNKTLNVIACRH